MNFPDPLRLYLLCGLIAHKAVWEWMKRRQPVALTAKAAPTLKLRLVKAVKVAILLGIIVQTMIGDVLPIQADASALRTAGALLYTAGLALALGGRIQLGENWLDIEDAAVKRRQTTVSTGIYGWIRHPIYTGDLLLLFGLELALNSWGVLLVLLLAPVVLRQAMQEERILLAKLPGYDLYCRRTKRFIPFLA